MQYLPRIYDTVLKRKLRASDAILIEGAKWCGKTTTAEQIAGSRLYMQKPDALEQNIRLAQISPSMLLEGETPRLIDEWQLAPELWDAVRFECDHRGKFGQFILTGSTVPPERGGDQTYGYRAYRADKDAPHESCGIRGFHWLCVVTKPS